ncbi:hypothetical protein OH76DRAFT_1490365 [Lentinus brumalis]|uniref:Uncharacterized protein n=1 Tax=Lentinus brumalis TaxID=2498619 RepID=A0A371CJ77_9APHY|nr:hypothetical protein OH76DRAFT_1490365 [Polyporus brumalis]
MITENRELKSLFAHEFCEIKSQLAGAPKGAPKDTDNELEEDISMEDLGAEADDKLLAAKRRSCKQKPPSIFDNPQLKPGIKNLQECTKKHLFLLCKAETPTELIEHNPPITDEEMQSFLDGEDDLLTCSVQSFRIGFVRPWKENAFNQVAKSVFSKSFLAMYKSGQYRGYDVPSTLLTESIVGRVLDKQMDYCRRMYKQHSKPLSQADIDHIKKRKAMNARRATRLFSLLRPIHMSGDETDGPVKTHPPTFRIVEARWQSFAFKTFLRTLDTLYRERWAHPVGDRATPGLWKNCYDKEWLASLRPHVRESLQIIDTNYDFTTPDPRVFKKQ